MNLVFDSCLSRRDAEASRAAGHQAEWIGDWSHYPCDMMLLQHACAREAVLITLDDSLGDSLIRHGQPHSGLIRLIDIPMRARAALLLAILDQYQNQLHQDYVLTANAERVIPTPPRFARR